MIVRVPKDIRPAFPVRVPRDQVRGKLLELLGIEQLPENVAFAKESEAQEDGLRVARGSYRNSLGEAVPSIIMLPEGGARPLAGVVCISGSSGDAERVAHPEFHRPEPYVGPLFGWGRELARRGFAAMAISVKACQARRPSPQEWADEGKLLLAYGRPQAGIIVEETMMAARVLAATDGVDPNRIGVTGMSLGGQASWYAMACAPWIRAAAPVCGGVGSMASLIHEGQVDRHSASYYLPHMLRYFDHPEIVAACIPPRPFMMVAPTEDEDMPKSGVDELIPVVAAEYEAMGRPERFKVYQPPGNHVFLFEYFEWVADWFKRFLTA